MSTRKYCSSHSRCHDVNFPPLTVDIPAILGQETDHFIFNFVIGRHRDCQRDNMIISKLLYPNYSFMFSFIIIILVGFLSHSLLQTLALLNPTTFLWPILHSMSYHCHNTSPTNMISHSKRARSPSPIRTLTVISSMMSDLVRAISPTRSRRTRTTTEEAASEFARNYVSFPGLDSQLSEGTTSDLESNYSEGQRGT